MRIALIRPSPLRSISAEAGSGTSASARMSPVTRSSRLKFLAWVDTVGVPKGKKLPASVLKVTDWKGVALVRPKNPSPLRASPIRKDLRVPSN